MANGGETAMRSVIAQLGERQQLASKYASGGRPSPAAKPQPAGNKPTGNGASGPGRLPLKPPPSSTAKSAVPDASSPPPGDRPAITARKSPQPTAAVAGQTDLLGTSRLKPTVPRKPAAVVDASEPGGEETGPAAPWQNLVKKKNVPPTPRARKQATTPSDAAAGMASDVDDQLTVVSSSTDDVRQPPDSGQSASEEDPGATSAAARVRSLKQAFEGKSQDSEDVGQMDDSGRGGTPRKIDGPSTSASAAENPPRPPADRDAAGRTRPPSSAATSLRPPGDRSPQPPPRRPDIGSGGPPAVDQQTIVVGVGGRRYRRLAPPAETTARPSRKPALPPQVDLTPFRSAVAPSTVVPAAAAVDHDDDDGEIYDDASAVQPPTTDEGRVTLRSSVGRQGDTAAVSVISEYTAEEELGDKRACMQGGTAGSKVAAAVCPPVSESSDDDIYDDVVDVARDQTETDLHEDDIYDEIN